MSSLISRDLAEPHITTGPTHGPGQGGGVGVVGWGHIDTEDGYIPVKLPWIFPGVPLSFNGASGNIQSYFTVMWVIELWTIVETPRISFERNSIEYGYLRFINVRFQSHEFGCYDDRIALKYDRHLGSAAAAVPVKFHRDWKSLKPNLIASRLHEILRQCVRPLSEWRP